MALQWQSGPDTMGGWGRMSLHLIVILLRSTTDGSPINV